MAPRGRDSYFLSEIRPNYSQGDIVEVPTTVLWSTAAGKGTPVGIPTMPNALGLDVRGFVWRAGSPADSVLHETRRGIAMVVSHSCLLDKEFNEFVAKLVAQHISEEEATAIAQARNDLDPTLLVAPLVPLSEIPMAWRMGIDDRFGYLRIPSPFDTPEDPTAPTSDATDWVADLHRLTMVEHRLIRDVFVSLTDEASSVLRFKLAEQFAARQLSNAAILAQLVDKRIVGVQVLPRNKKVAKLRLQLEGGEDCILEIKPPSEVADDDPPEIVRAPGTRRPVPRGEPRAQHGPQTRRGWREKVHLFFHRLLSRN